MPPSGNTYFPIKSSIENRNINRIEGTKCSKIILTFACITSTGTQSRRVIRTVVVSIVGQRERWSSSPYKCIAACDQKQYLDLTLLLPVSENRQATITSHTQNNTNFATNSHEQLECIFVVKSTESRRKMKSMAKSTY